MNVPWNAESVKLKVTKHFMLKYMRYWNWDFNDLRDAVVQAYKVDKVGRAKYELYVQKGGFKKMITVFFDEVDELVFISGSEGGGRK